jgi:hypothetical protein
LVILGLGYPACFYLFYAAIKEGYLRGEMVESVVATVIIQAQLVVNTSLDTTKNSSVQFFEFFLVD